MSRTASRKRRQRAREAARQTPPTLDAPAIAMHQIASEAAGKAKAVSLLEVQTRRIAGDPTDDEIDAVVRDIIDAEPDGPTLELDGPDDVDVVALRVVDAQAALARPPVFERTSDGTLKVDVGEGLERVADFAEAVDQAVGDAMAVSASCVKLERLLSLVLGRPLGVLRERFGFQLFPDLDETSDEADAGFRAELKETDRVVFTFSGGGARMIWSATLGDWLRVVSTLRPGSGLGAIAGAFWDEVRATELGEQLAGDPSQE